MNSYMFPFITEEASLPLYVKGVGGLENQVSITRPNGYYDYQWLHCVKGKGRLLIDGKEFIIPKNAGFFMYPGIPHQYYAIEEPWETHWVNFDGEGVIPLLNALGFGRYNVYCFDDIRSIDNLIYDIFIISQSNGLMSGHRCSAKLYCLLIDLRTLVREIGEKSGEYKMKRLKPVLEYIETNYNSNPTIDELSAIIGVSPQYLCKLFNKVLNTRPIIYLNLFKMNKAKKLFMTYPDISVKEVAKIIGYNDPSYFCALFKKHEGVTPMEFRNTIPSQIL
jgi:AraC family transcriptional regulator of arabinose operon